MKKLVAAALLSGAILLTGCSSGRTVYYAKGGAVYHSKSTCSNMKHPISTSYEEAIAMGLRRCKRCW